MHISNLPIVRHICTKKVLKKCPKSRFGWQKGIKNWIRHDFQMNWPHIIWGFSGQNRSQMLRWKNFEGGPVFLTRILTNLHFAKMTIFHPSNFGGPPPARKKVFSAHFSWHESALLQREIRPFYSWIPWWNFIRFNEFL